MREAHFRVTVHYESGQYMIKAEESEYSRYNTITNSLPQVMTKQFKITRDLKKIGVQAYFEYEN